MKRMMFDGTEMVEVEVPDRAPRDRFRLEDVCPPDSECLAAVRRIREEAEMDSFRRRTGLGRALPIARKPHQMQLFVLRRKF